MESQNLAQQSLKSELSRLNAENQKFKSTASALKGELSALRSELTSLGIEESIITEQLLGLRDANEMLLAKSNSLDS